MQFKKIFFILFVSLCFSIYSNGQNVDINILESINKSETTFKNNFFKTTAQSVTIFNIAAPASLLTVGIVKHDKQMQKNAAYMIGGFVASSIVTQGMKRIIKRERPFVTYPYLIKRDVGGSYSFPSGHTSSAFAFATSISLAFPKWYVIAPSYVYACAAGYSRMHLGVHFPSDILAGAIVGAGSAVLSNYLQRKISVHYSRKKALKL